MGGDRADGGPGEVSGEVGAEVGGEDTAAGPAPVSGRRWPWIALVLLALVIGAGCGWVARDVTDVPASSPPGPPVAATPTPVPGVPCPAAADAGAVIRAELDRAVGALRDFDPRALRGVLDEVQRQQARLEAAIAACRASVAAG